MGADLIGYFAKGPRHLDAAHTDAATRTADQRLDWLRRATACFSSLGELPDADAITSHLPQLEALLQECPLLAHEDRTQPATADWPTLIDEVDALVRRIDDFETVTGRGAVDRFVRDWPPAFRDTACATDPDDPSKVLVFAGERSWGDTPEGAGFTGFAAAEVLGIPEAFGVWLHGAFMTLTLPPRK